MKKLLPPSIIWMKLISRLIILLLIVGCDNSTEPEDVYGCTDAVSGQLKDLNGNNIENAAILLTYDMLAPSEASNPREKIQMPCTMINYGISNDTHVYIWIESMCGDTINVVKDDYQVAGYHSITWCAVDLDGNQVVDGNYKFHMTTNDETHKQDVFLLVYDFSTIENITGHNYHAITDANGRFSIPLDCLSFGVVLIGMDALGNPTDPSGVPYKAKLWIIHDDHPTFSTEFYDVNPNNGVYIDIEAPF